MPTLLSHLKHTLAQSSPSPSSASASTRTARSATHPTLPSSPTITLTTPSRAPSSKPLTLTLPFRRRKHRAQHHHREHSLPAPQLTESPSRFARLKSKTASTRETLLLASENAPGRRGRGKKKMTRLPLTEHNIGTLMGELSGTESTAGDDGDGDVVFEEERERRRKVEEMRARREGRERGVREWLEGVEL